jgi:hypothetical protein
MGVDLFCKADKCSVEQEFSVLEAELTCSSTDLDCHPLIQAVGMKEVVTRRQCIGPTEIDVHDSAPDNSHIGSGGCKSRFVVQRMFVARSIRSRYVVDKDGFHADRTVSEVLTTGL